MPPKLQVDESFAFLFICIEASGCKIDFKLVGDATDLQPAAARMRYARLKKAVEAGHFKGAILTQPPQTSPHLAAMANPESRRLATAPGSNRQAKTRNTSSVQNSSYHNNQRLRRYLSHERSDEEEEEEEHVEEDRGREDEETEEAENHSHGPVTEQRNSKRKASTVHLGDDNHGLFYPDTSTASRRAKHIKRSESDEESETPEPDNDEDVDYTPTKRNNQQPRRQANRNKSQVNSTPVSTVSIDPATVSKHMIQSQANTNSGTSQQGQCMPTPSSFEEFSQAMHKFYPGNRFKQYTPPQSLQAVGVVSGAAQPTQEDFSFAATTGQHPMRLVNRATNSYNGYQSSSTWSPTNPSQAQLKAHQKLLHNHNLPSRQGTPIITSPLAHSHTSNISLGTNPARIGQAINQAQFQETQPMALQSQVQHLPQPHTNPRPHAVQSHNRTSRSRFHPASVFDGFQPPGISPFAPTQKLPMKRKLNQNSFRGHLSITQSNEPDIYEHHIDPQLRSTAPHSSSHSHPQINSAVHNESTSCQPALSPNMSPIANHGRQPTRIKADASNQATQDQKRQKQAEAEAEAAETLNAMASTNRQDAPSKQDEKDTSIVEIGSPENGENNGIPQTRENTDENSQID